MKYLVVQHWVVEVYVEADNPSHASELASDIEHETPVFEYAGIDDDVYLIEGENDEL